MYYCPLFCIQDTPSEERIELDENQIEDVRTLNGTFPKIDNLEYFPQKVLIHIFSVAGAVDLLSLAEISSRFESIVRIALNQRYADEYFTISASMYGSSQAYKNFLEHFGSEIKSLELSGIGAQDDNYWMGSVLSRMKCVEKLRIIGNSTISNEEILEQYVSSKITHLTLLSRAHPTGNGFVLSKFRNLKHFAMECYPSISVETFKEVIFKNPALESLSLGRKYGLILGEDWLARLGQLDLLMRFIAMNLNGLKELSLHSCTRGLKEPAPNFHLILDRFITSMKHLESFYLKSNFSLTDRCELLRRLGSKCKNIKHLELYLHRNETEDPHPFLVIPFFEQIESLTLVLRWMEYENPNENKVWSSILELLPKCQSLKKIIINLNISTACVEAFGTARFFSHFVRCIQMRNISLKLRYQCYSTIEDIGKVTRNEVIWRNKLVHWMGYDPSLNSSNVHFMDLANQSTASNAEQSRIPFNLILSYLDLNSLQSLSHVNQKCSQLVENYVIHHSQQNGTFTITNEFFTDVNEEYKRLSMFTEYVINLRMNIIHDRIAELPVMLQQFENLRKLYVRSETYTQSRNMIVPNVRHFIFDGLNFQYYCQLRDLSTACPNLETLEFKQKNLLDVKYIRDDDDEEEGEEISEAARLKFKNLRKLTLAYGNAEQMRQLNAVFENKNTELIFTN